MFAAYVRVSTTGQNVAGQRREIRRWLQGNGLSEIHWYVDKDSGDYLDRPELDRLQNDIFMGQIDGVVVWKLDRLSRSMKDGIVTLEEWLSKGIRFVSVTQNFDFQGAIGKIVAALLFGIAEMEQETRRERQAAGIAAARERGVYKGRQPGTQKAPPERALQLRKRGLTISEVAQALGVSRATVHRYLHQAD
ncbi:MAG: resolvase [Planctomycetaceae bacterium]|nr:resolvase [Planctomycetaceae bacterium]